MSCYAVPGGVPGCTHPYVDHLDTSHQHALCVNNSICFTKEIFNIKMKMAVKEKEMPAVGAQGFRYNYGNMIYRYEIE